MNIKRISKQIYLTIILIIMLFALGLVACNKNVGTMTSGEEAINYKNVKAGNIKENILYYGTKPSDDKKAVIVHFEKENISLEYFKTEEIDKEIVRAMTDMAKNEGPYYIHAEEANNKARQLLIVMEGLAAASYEEMKELDMDDFLRYIADDDPYTGNGTIEIEYLDWVNVMGRYLEKHGMKDEDISKWYANLTSENYSDPG